MKHIDFKEIVASKAPETAKKIPNFVYYILEKWLCVEQINVVMERHKDLQGVDFVRDVIRVVSGKDQRSRERKHTTRQQAHSGEQSSIGRF